MNRLEALLIVIASLGLGFAMSAGLTSDIGYYWYGNKFGLAFWITFVAISLVTFLLFASILNHLNFGKFRPFIRHNSPNQR